MSLVTFSSPMEANTLGKQRVRFGKGQELQSKEPKGWKAPRYYLAQPLRCQRRSGGPDKKASLLKRLQTQERGCYEVAQLQASGQRLGKQARFEKLSLPEKYSWLYITWKPQETRAQSLTSVPASHE